MSVSRTVSAILLLCLADVCVVCAQSGSAGGGVPLTAPLAVGRNTEVPGRVLRPGSYTLRVVDHLADRMVLQVQDAKGRPLSTFLGVDAQALRPAAAGSGPLLWANSPSAADAMRGYSFPGGSTVEFVYPKEDAVAIAKVNAAKVAAIDPASELKVPAEHLSAQDLEMVTLWTLSATRVGPEGDSQPAIAAERYRAPTPAPVAANATPSGARSALNGAATPHARADGSVGRAHGNVSIASATPTEAGGLKALPHTASPLPLAFTAALGLLLAGAALRKVRPVPGA